MGTTDTSNPQVCHINKKDCVGYTSTQWLLEKTSTDVKDVPLLSANNELRVLFCGQEAFGCIAQDIAAAKKSIDIIFWGFDPGMMLERSGSQWEAEKTYGALLEAASARGVQVRLLAWDNYAGGGLNNNLPGHSGWGIQVIHGLGVDVVDSPEEIRYNFNLYWFRRYLNSQKGPLQFRTRDGSQVAANKALAGEKNQPEDFIENRLLREGSTHHQKTILIDFDPPDQGIGYVMGLNSITDYWDTEKHEINDSLREANTDAAEIKRGWTCKKPLRDYACRIAGGGVLAQISDNFARAWERAGGENGPAVSTPGQVPYYPAEPVRAQILRTQPEEDDKCIKAFYLHSNTVAQDYLYIENQYMFYQEWAQQLLEQRRKYVTDWREKFDKTPNPAVKGIIGEQDMPKLHLFIVTPEPEHAEQIPRTYDTLKELGQEGGLRGKKSRTVSDGDGGYMEEEYGDEIGQDVRMTKYQKDLEAQQKQYEQDLADYKSNPRTFAPPPRPGSPNNVVKTALTIPKRSANELENKYGLKVCTAMLYTCGQNKDQGSNSMLDFRDIYIHSKLMIVDDCSFTLGSANMNQRSMTVDSEINIACDDPKKTADLRQRVFMALSGNAIHGGVGQEKTAKTFKDWKTLMEDNASNRKKHEPMTGFLLPFKELRETETRYA